ncbi:LysR family transcriptional regulator [Siccirubricoccus deserti]|uniref:LysR family transcriptional regulator n=1 Tax=Siccirubricoccus deserti TaxID=2013562 RepID=A0A9X0R4N8_9PROT|nr:LysR family transcriptional regulator [Siccirubricoccus deserti]
MPAGTNPDMVVKSTETTTLACSGSSTTKEQDVSVVGLTAHERTVQAFTGVGVRHSALLKFQKRKVPTLEIHEIRCFLAICQARNLSRATTLCNVIQPAPLHAVQEMEGEFGGPPFARARGKATSPGLASRLQPIPCFPFLSSPEQRVADCAGGEAQH